MRETKDFRGGLVTYQKKVKEAIQKKIYVWSRDWPLAASNLTFSGEMKTDQNVYVRKKEAFIDFNHEESEDDEVGKR